MSTIGAGESPLALARQFMNAKRGLTDESIPARLMEADPGASEFRAMQGLGNDVALNEPVFGNGMWKESGRLGRAANKSYHFNTAVDEMFRSMVYLAKVEKGMAPDLAIQEALKAMGDFSRMSALERGYVREVLPFYAWARHITQLTLRLPIEHPMRVAWTLHLADAYGDDQASLPDFARGGVKLGANSFLPATSLNPFTDISRSALLSPTGFAAATSPIIKIPAFVGQGFDLSHGFKQATRPPGVGNRTERGNLEPGPILNPAAIGNYIVNQVPIARGVRSAIQGDAGRYNTGQIIKDKKGNIVYPGTQGKLGAMAGTLFPIPRRINNG
jgi:hypothetical protein